MSKLLMGSQPKPTPLAKLPDPEPVAIPSPEDPASLEAQRRARMAALERKGRASTILSGTDAVIKPAYSNTFLGE